jgi:hypothetical protein
VFDDCTPIAGLILQTLSELEQAGASATPEALDALRRDSELEPFVFRALLAFRSAQIAPQVVHRLDSEYSACRWYAFDAIRQLDLRVTDAVPRLSFLLRGQDWEERTDAAAALVPLGDSRAIGPLIEALSQPPAKAQRAAARALGNIGPVAAGAVPRLERVARTHWAWSVRDAAADAASKITGKVVKPRPPSCKTSAAQIEDHWIVTTDGKKQTLDPVRPDSPPRPGRGACAGADAGWDLFPLLEEGETCIAGENLGEFGGKIVRLGRRRREVLRDDANPLRAVRLGSDLFVIEGLEHISWGGWGTLTRLSRDSRGDWRAEPLLELPGVPVAFAVRGERLLLLVKDALDGDDQPCPAAPGTVVVPFYLLRFSPDGTVESLP